ncbi:unnamed protein product, partial [Strongylus vulgaris]
MSFLDEDQSCEDLELPIFKNEAKNIYAASSAIPCANAIFKVAVAIDKQLARSVRPPDHTVKQRKDSSKDRSQRSGHHRPPFPSYRPDGRSDSGEEGKNDGDPRNEFAAKLRKFFAISLFAYGILYMLAPKPEGPVGTEPITWSEFVSHVLPTGQIQKIIVFPERDVAYIYTYAGAKTRTGERMAAIYRLGIPSVPKFEEEVRAAEAAARLPPEYWTP